MQSWRIEHGNCITTMAAMPEASVDAIVCDPPYGLEFMGREWDGANGFRRSLNDADVGRDTPHGRASRTSPEYRAGRLFGEWCETWGSEALRILKPGGHLLAFGGTRTYHRLTCGLEDAGFDVRDCLQWLYGSGFPKSLDVSKAIDKAAGADREDLGPGQWAHVKAGGTWNGNVYGDEPIHGEGPRATAPATEDAKRWNGWGTALKPAHEPIVLARKPLSGTVAANVLNHGTGGLNIDGCRIDGTWTTWRRKDGSIAPGGDAVNAYGPGLGRQDGEHPAGRWPANVVLDETAAAMLDEQSGERGGAGVNRVLRRGHTTGSGMGYGSSSPQNAAEVGYGDSGGASRFLYVAKASTAERNAGLDHLPLVETGKMEDDAYEWAMDGKGNPRSGPTRARNPHPTVKPVELMRWLCRLVTPKGGIVLDPFTGSGTTGIAALREGFSFIGIEQDTEYVRIARARIVGDAPLINGATEVAA